MVCKNCSKELAEGDLFCPKCGNKVTESVVQAVTETQNQKGINVLRIMSIIGFVYFSLGILSFFNQLDTEGGLFEKSAYFYFALAYAIVVLVQDKKYNLKLLKRFAVLGIVLYIICSASFEVNNWTWTSPQVQSIIGISYALVFSIFTFIKVKMLLHNK